MSEQMVPSAGGMRIVPKLPPGAFRSFSILAPVATHFRPATCAEVRCERYEHGWSSTFEANGWEAHYVRRESGRKYTEESLPGGLTRFSFEPGQRCFASADHKLRVDRPEIYIARAGDWRGTDGDAYKHSGSADWMDEFAAYQDRLARAVERG